jgi:hypothetical protein
MSNKDRQIRNLRKFNNIALYDYTNLCSFNLNCPFKKGQNPIINSCKGCQNIDIYKYYVDNLSCHQLLKFRKTFNPNIL